MKLIDSEGRLFGKINIIDFLIVAFFTFLLPALYVGYQILSGMRKDNLAKIESPLIAAGQDSTTHWRAYVRWDLPWDLLEEIKLHKKFEKIEVSKSWILEKGKWVKMDNPAIYWGYTWESMDYFRPGISQEINNEDWLGSSRIREFPARLVGRTMKIEKEPDLVISAQ